uniref:Uncharacterized protein n=1 Tax=Pipistrellus kuhlii TaxID=59472 RepID=A0A7J7VC32_PIPKU|nr:hypothetical protein mPipKuh1_008534 [Pipistrellus kuhlii]
MQVEEEESSQQRCPPECREEGGGLDPILREAGVRPRRGHPPDAQRHRFPGPSGQLPLLRAQVWFGTKRKALRQDCGSPGGPLAARVRAQARDAPGPRPPAPHTPGAARPRADSHRLLGRSSCPEGRRQGPMR